MNTLIIRRREPFEIVFLALLALAAVTQLIIGSPPGSITMLLPGWFSEVWACLTLFGSLTALLGALIPGAITGLFMERLGLSVSAGAISIYGAAVLVVGEVKGLTTTALCVAILIAFLMRRRELTQVIKQLPTTKPDEAAPTS